uniref:Uncharacterized protein n=1 Tax=Anguilla anguilla TaxID=7936 RepID=A0A0E9TCJ4_ANGAN
MYCKALQVLESMEIGYEKNVIHQTTFQFSQ